MRRTLMRTGDPLHDSDNLHGVYKDDGMLPSTVLITFFRICIASMICVLPAPLGPKTMAKDSTSSFERLESSRLSGCSVIAVAFKLSVASSLNGPKLPTVKSNNIL